MAVVVADVVAGLEDPSKCLKEAEPSLHTLHVVAGLTGSEVATLNVSPEATVNYVKGRLCKKARLQVDRSSVKLAYQSTVLDDTHTIAEYDLPAVVTLQCILVTKEAAQVAVRIVPTIEETCQDERCLAVDPEDKSAQLTKFFEAEEGEVAESDTRKFPMDAVFTARCSEESIFQTSLLESVQRFVAGHEVNIVMLGNGPVSEDKVALALGRRQDSRHEWQKEGLGLLPRIVDQAIALVEELDASVHLSMSMLDISWEGLARNLLLSYSDVVFPDRVESFGRQSFRSGATLKLALERALGRLGEGSGRTSHLIFSLNVEQRTVLPNDTVSVREGKLRFVVLADLSLFKRPCLPLLLRGLHDAMAAATVTGSEDRPAGALAQVLKGSFGHGAASVAIGCADASGDYEDNLELLKFLARFRMVKNLVEPKESHVCSDALTPFNERELWISSSKGNSSTSDIGGPSICGGGKSSCI